MTLRGLILLLAWPCILAQDLAKLPEWARSHAAVLAEPAPADSDAWVLFDRTEVAYTGDGEIRTRRLRLVKVLSERGLDQATFRLLGLGGKAARLAKLKGWNLRPDGDVTRLDQEHIVSFDNASNADISTSTLTFASLPKVTKGSLVAFESVQVIHHPMGPIDAASIMESCPIHRWEFEPVTSGGWFSNLSKVEVRVDWRHFLPWLGEPHALGQHGLALDRVAALPDPEVYGPAPRNCLPQVRVRFLDPALKDSPSWKDWNSYAAWVWSQYSARLLDQPLPGLKGKDPAAGLPILTAWMAKELHYRAVYLSPERGWIPLQAQEIGRRTYGDCKDLTCFLMAQTVHLGLQACPALALLGEGEIEKDEPPSLLFNHVITAIELPRSFGLAAELETAGGRFLLVDPTDRFTPLGYLGMAHQGGKLLICTREGGIWVEIPDKAILPAQVTLSLKGDADAQGGMNAHGLILEQGDGWGLRSVAQVQGTSGLLTHLRTRVLDLPGTATLEILRLGDPLAVSERFQVEFRTVYPDAVRILAGEAKVPAIGWRIFPGLIQKPGLPRHYAVRQGTEASLEIQGELAVPFHCTPILSRKTGDTPFRSFAWNAEAEVKGAGSQLTWHLSHRCKTASFGYDQREEGVAASRRDRSQLKGLEADGLAFKLLP